MKSIIVLTAILSAAAAMPLKSQDITISNLTVLKMTAAGQQETVLQVSFDLSDLSSTTIEVLMGAESSCEGVYRDFYHIKKYSDGYYLKHKNTTHKLGGKKISFEMELDDMTYQGSRYLCVVTKAGEEVTSNTASVELQK